MSVNRQTGVTTTMGLRDHRPPRCMKCGERKDGLFTVNPNGQEVCPDCAAPKHREVLVRETVEHGE